MRKRKYEDCERTDGLCGICSLSSYGNDCHGNRINRILYYRSISGLTQREVSEASGIDIRRIQRFESGECDIGNMTLKNAIALANVFEISPDKLI